jgi:flagellar hook-length control protein FliK
MLFLHAFFDKGEWPDDCRTGVRQGHEVKIVPSVESQTSAVASALNPHTRTSKSFSSRATGADSGQFSDLLEQTAPRDDEPAPSSSRRSERPARSEPRTAADRTRDSDPGDAEEPTADAPPCASSDAQPQPVAAAPTKSDTAETIPAEPVSGQDANTSPPVEGASSDATAVVVPVAPVVPPPAPVASATVGKAVADEQALEAPAIAAAAAAATGKPASAATPASDGQATPGAVAPAPSEPGVTAPAKTDKPATETGTPAPMAARQPATNPQAVVPDHAEKTDAAQPGAREAATVSQQERRSAKVANATPEAAAATVDSGSHLQHQASPHTGLEPLPTVGTGPLTHTAAAAAPAAAAQAPATAIPIASVAVEIVARAQAGNSRFEIRLDPPELGRIDVKLDVDRHGNVTSHLVVERSETLDLLRREAPQLERTLNDAGLKTGDSALQFSLRDQGTNAERDPRSARLPPVADITGPLDEPAPLEAVRNYRWSGTTGGIDIRV